MGELVDAMALPQPSVSKHLRVLRAVGLVATRRDGRRVFYRLNAEAIRPMRDWVGMFDAYLDRQLERVKERAESKEREQGRRPAAGDPARDRTDTTSR